MNRFFASLRSRLILLALLAIIPAVGAVVYSGVHERHGIAATTQRSLLNLALLSSAQQNLVVESARQFPAGLARLPEIRAGDADACSALFADLLKEYPRYANIGVTMPNGDLWCTAVPAGEPINYADRVWFQEVMKTRSLVAAGYVLGRITRKPLAPFAYPLLDEAGQVHAVVFAGLELSWLSEFLGEVPLPPGAVLAVIDNQGTIMARSLEPEQ